MSSTYTSSSPSSSSSSSSDSSNNGPVFNSSDIISYLALVISLAALATTFLQALQQYLASADGYRRCAPSVMGLWAKGTRRKFRRRELRYEVVFETPVIFTAHPDNTKGPIPGKPIIKVNGTPASYEDSQTMQPGEEVVSNVHTADDERASWVTILEAFQTLERDSRNWESDHRTSIRGIVYDSPTYTICHMMQKKVRSWDFMPTNIIKPFATTALCHLVEMVSMLGMFWKQFEVENGSLRAEGNGYMLTSTVIHGLGIVNTFSLTGPQKPTFKERRIIPCSEVKSLTFGFVPSLLGRDLELSNDICAHKTLLAIGCSDKDVLAYKKYHMRPYMYSISFELIGLTANPFRIPGSNFRMLPNPTHTSFVPQLCFLKFLRAFTTNSKSFSSVASSSPHPLLVIIGQHFKDTTNISFTKPILAATSIDLDVREAAHAAHNATTDYINTHIDKRLLSSVIATHLSAVLVASDVLQAAANNLTASKEENVMKFYFDYVRPLVAAGDLGVGAQAPDGY